MSKYLSTRSVFAATLSVIAGIAISAGAANASVTSQLGKCKFNSRDETVHCCSLIIKNQDKPWWFKENFSSCEAAVACQGGGYSKASSGKRVCWVRMYDEQHYGSEKGTKVNEGGRRGNRGGGDNVK